MPIVSADWPVWASNFYPDSGKTGWRTTEHIYQAMKTLDPILRQEIKDAPTPNQAKKLGRKVKLRPAWEEIKETVMLEAVRIKFSPGSVLSRSLMAHEGPLVEQTSWHDLVWGICICSKHNGQGENKLGKILMQVRSELLK